MKEECGFGHHKSLSSPYKTGLANKVAVRKEGCQFPLDCERIVKSCDSSRFWLIVERSITSE